jgi:hypothetical protein
LTTEISKYVPPMTFDELNLYVPYVTPKDGHKLHALKTKVCENVRVGQPGKYWDRTVPLGGDAVVEVNDAAAGWKWKKFRHDHLFVDLEVKAQEDVDWMQKIFAPALVQVVFGASPDALYDQADPGLPGVNASTLLAASQALALAEHRRYARMEAAGGGRFLPVRFAMGIVFEIWPASEATRVMYQGLPGLHSLEARFGTAPKLHDLKEL